MPDHRMDRRENRRAFRPTLDGKLETRVLMAASAIKSHIAAGGQAVLITNPGGQQFYVSVINGGTVRATAATGGRVNLVVDGSTPSTALEVNLVIPRQAKNSAHTFNNALASPTNKLNIASITVSTGMIAAIEGYQTANLSGPITVAGTSPINRIALDNILPGGSITTGGDLDTLDIYNNATFSGGNLSIGRDLNWFQAFGNLTISGNSNATVTRDVGLTFQVAKGSGNAGQGIYIGGNVEIDPGSTLTVGRNIPAGVLINGNFSGVSRFVVNGSTALSPNPTFNFGVVDVLGTLSA